MFSLNYWEVFHILWYFIFLRIPSIIMHSSDYVSGFLWPYVNFLLNCVFQHKKQFQLWFNEFFNNFYFIIFIYFFWHLEVVRVTSKLFKTGVLDEAILLMMRKWHAWRICRMWKIFLSRLHHLLFRCIWIEKRMLLCSTITCLFAFSLPLCHSNKPGVCPNSSNLW